MSWQRIDENTYIDDTLVTCAEYQLFIDEMCEQGKYYQPDHWTSYQFPKGQAREPILGIRHEDAAAFCKWLAQREHMGWKYRLPTQQEALTSTLNSLNKSPLGYWINEYSRFEKANKEFVRIEPIPFDAPHSSSVTDHIVYSTPIPGLNLDIASFYADQLSRHYPAAHQKDVVWLVGHSSYRRYAQEHNRIHILEETINITRDIAHDFDQIIARDLTNQPSFIIKIFRAFQKVVHYFVNSKQGRVYNYEQNIKNLHDMALDVCTNIMFLQERIVGRSLAFEGIRLVKERIR